jgi:hypothetical protein
MTHRMAIWLLSILIGLALSGCQNTGRFSQGGDLPASEAAHG